MLINELLNEVVPAIQHILDIKQDEVSDPFDELSGNFNPAKYWMTSFQMVSISTNVLEAHIH
jgi:hypothetical protein